MKIVSIGDVTNDGVNYEMWLDQPFSQPPFRLEQTRREGKAPLITAAYEDPLALGLNILVYGDTEAETKGYREALLKTLDTASAAIPLVVSDDDDGDQRFRHVVVQAVDEQKDEEGVGQKFVATLITHSEGRWRSTTPVQLTWEVAASGETLVVENPGSLPVYPTYSLQPTDAKAGGSGAFVYRRFCSLKWTGVSQANTPTNITDGIWDTETLIDAFKINQFGDADYTKNVGVINNGVAQRRWVTNIDTAGTSVWVNLDWNYCPVASLEEAIDIGESITQIVIDHSIHFFPYRGILQIGDELFTYTHTDLATQTFLGVERAMKGSDAESHAVGAEVHLIQHDLWLLYGGSGRGVINDSYKPMLDLESSSNSSWHFTHFGEATGAENRPMVWSSSGPQSSVGTDGDPFDELVLLNGSWLSGTSAESLWVLRATGTLASARLIGRARSWEPWQVWQTGLYAGGGVYVPIPELESLDPGLIDFDLTVTETRHADDIRFYQRCGGAVEIRMDTLTLTWSDYPVATMRPEVEVYDLALQLTNTTTDQTLTFTLTLELNDLLVVDTLRYTAVLDSDGSNQYQALSRDSRRRDLLPLIPGDNTLRITEEGLQGLTLFIEFTPRTYS